MRFDAEAGFAGRPPGLPTRGKEQGSPRRTHVSCRSNGRLLQWVAATGELRLSRPAGLVVVPAVGAAAAAPGAPAVLLRHPVAELVLYRETRRGELAWENKRLAFLDQEGRRVFELTAWNADWSGLAQLAAAAGLTLSRYELPSLNAFEWPGRSELVSDAIFPWRFGARWATRRWWPED